LIVDALIELFLGCSIGVKFLLELLDEWSGLGNDGILNWSLNRQRKFSLSMLMLLCDRCNLNWQQSGAGHKREAFICMGNRLIVVAQFIGTAGGCPKANQLMETVGINMELRLVAL